MKSAVSDAVRGMFAGYLSSVALAKKDLSSVALAKEDVTGKRQRNAQKDATSRIHVLKLFRVYSC